jgi:hypothetical protein
VNDGALSHWKPLLRLGFLFCRGRGWDADHRCCLTFFEVIEQYNNRPRLRLTGLGFFTELNRVMVSEMLILIDLDEHSDRELQGFELPTQDLVIVRPSLLDRPVEGDSSRRQHTGCRSATSLIGVYSKPSGAGRKAMDNELVALGSFTRFDIMERKVADGTITRVKRVPPVGVYT